MITRQALRLGELWQDEVRRGTVTPVYDLVTLPGAGEVTFVEGALTEGLDVRCAAR